MASATHTVKKGNQLENKFYNYLLEQKERGELVFGAHPADLCKVFKKKKYYCPVRRGKVEFDVVLEVFRQNQTEPYIFIIFECKNYTRSVPESSINDFSSKVDRIFPQRAKAVLVVCGAIQSGAMNVAKSRGIGIIRYNELGIDTVLNRDTSVGSIQRRNEEKYYSSDKSSDAPHFLAVHNDMYFYSFTDYYRYLVYNDAPEDVIYSLPTRVPYLSEQNIRLTAEEIMARIKYSGGAVDLRAICVSLGIKLKFKERNASRDLHEKVLGTANFTSKTIEIFKDDVSFRERFTLAHEIGHFCLKHYNYIISDSFVEENSVAMSDDSEINYNRLEYQANKFASYLLLPERYFRGKIAEIRVILDIKDKGHGYIYVDDQYRNATDFAALLAYTSEYFQVSLKVIELRLKDLGMLTDKRSAFTRSDPGAVLQNAITNIFGRQ